ncbi:MAG: hypothetical protein JJT77_01730 [Crocinitomicaceae bacterium]|nr:hypothetical protein [Crocinitomicaceae bacterium]
MLKVELSKYPIEISEIDKLVIFMVYHEIEDIKGLLSIKPELLKEYGGWTEALNASVETIRKYNQL